MVDETRTAVIPATAEQRQAVAQRLRRPHLAPRERERLEMVKAATLGSDEAAIAQWGGRTVRTVPRWLGRVVVEGLEALRDAPRTPS